MIIETIKNMVLRNKLTKYPNIYSDIMKISDDILPGEAMDAISIIDPSNTEIITTSNPEEFRKLIIVKSYEKFVPLLEVTDGISTLNPYKNVYLTDEESAIYNIIGEDLKVGRNITKIDASRENIEPFFNPDKLYFIVKINYDRSKVITKKSYQVIVYIPK